MDYIEFTAKYPETPIDSIVSIIFNEDEKISKFREGFHMGKLSERELLFRIEMFKACKKEGVI